MRGTQQVASSIQSLLPLGGFSFKVEHSEGLEARAGDVAKVVSAGLHVLSDVLGFSPTLTLRVLSRDDWAHYATHPIYGMPHAVGTDTIAVAADPPEFWDGIRGWVFRPVLPEEMASLAGTYGFREDGEVDVRPFNDLVVLHALARIFHRQVPFNFPRTWLRELFANLCQYVAVAEGMPARLEHLNALPRAVQRPAVDVPLTALRDFDEKFDRVGLANFVWYEWQLLLAAKAIYNAEGPSALRRLFDCGLTACERPMDDAELAAKLERKACGRVAEIMRNWPRVA